MKSYVLFVTVLIIIIIILRWEFGRLALLALLAICGKPEKLIRTRSHIFLLKGKRVIQERHILMARRCGRSVFVHSGGEGHLQLRRIAFSLAAFCHN